jgi:hypothetical protein
MDASRRVAAATWRGGSGIIGGAMSVVVVVVVVFGAVVAAEVALARPGDPSDPSDPSEAWNPDPVNRTLMLVGLGVLAVSLFLPFARNDAGCLDHCYEAHRWYWWNPAQNLGAPLLFIGIAGAATRLRPRPATRVPVRPSAVCGWLGAAFVWFVAPVMVDEFLYGGPSAEISPTSWVAPVGWALLWAGSTRLPQMLHRAWSAAA